MKYLLTIFLSLFIFSSYAEINCAKTGNFLKEECKKKREEEKKNKKLGYLEEENQENIWTVSVMQYGGKDTSNWSVIASVNGKITHGDRFRIRILPKSIETCSIGNSFTTFYTTKNNNNFSDLSGVIPAIFKEVKIGVEILFAKEFLMGQSVFIDLGWNELKDIKDFFKKEKEVSLRLLDSKTITVDNYFDIIENKFSLVGLSDALDRAKNECFRIVKERNS